MGEGGAAVLWQTTLRALPGRQREHARMLVTDWPEAREICAMLYRYMTDGHTLGVPQYCEAVRSGIASHRAALLRPDRGRLCAFLEGLVTPLAAAPFGVRDGAGERWRLGDGEPLSRWVEGRGSLALEHADPVPRAQLAGQLYPQILEPRIAAIVAEEGGPCSVPWR